MEEDDFDIEDEAIEFDLELDNNDNIFKKTLSAKKATNLEKKRRIEAFLEDRQLARELSEYGYHFNDVDMDFDDMLYD